MTGTELIKIVTKKAGIPESEAKLFFELFIKGLSDIMKPGESAKFSDVGYFHLRTAKKNAGSNEYEKVSSGKDKINVMLFSKEVEQMDDLDNNFVFTVHNIPESEHDEIDSYFSLSVGKPVFPVEGFTDDGELFRQKSGIEIRKALLSKAEQLISSIEKLEGVMGKEEIVFEKSLLSKRKKGLLKSESDYDETSISGEDPFLSAEDIRKRDFNFGESTEKQIENDAAAEAGKGVKPKADLYDSDSEKLPWNFGREVFDKKVEYKREVADNIPTEKEKDEEEPVEEIESEKPSDEITDIKEDEPETFSIIDDAIDADETGSEIEEEDDDILNDFGEPEKLKSIIDDYITKDEPEKFGS
ncbi:MAG: hypothetical protein HKM87_08565, partial [Ignavibacteriaceae bacterium]|nr:hypothetical protein [Ignavibacteriaceae bacterium]